MRDVLVVVAADPRESARALEGLRMSVGLALAGNRVRVCLEEAARPLAEPERYAFPAWPDAADYLAALRDLGGEIADGGGWLAGAGAARVVIRWSA